MKEKRKAGLRRIPLVGGESVLVSAVDYERLRNYRWMLLTDRSGVVRRIGSGKRGKSRVVWMSREILGLPHEAGDGPYVTYRNGDHLDLRRENLRLVNVSQNHQSARKKKDPTKPSYSRYIGVSRASKNRWAAAINVDGKKKYLGLFPSEESAAEAYDEAVLTHHGPQARVNFSE